MSAPMPLDQLEADVRAGRVDLDAAVAQLVSMGYFEDDARSIAWVWDADRKRRDRSKP